MAYHVVSAAAVEATVRDGDGWRWRDLRHLIPYEAGHEVIRQGKQHLTFIRMTPDLIYDQLIGMGLVDKVVFSWGGNSGVGSLHRLRDAQSRTAGRSRWPGRAFARRHGQCL